MGMVRKFVVRREGGLYAYEKALERAGLTPVAGADEAGRGACAGPLVAAAHAPRPASSAPATYRKPRRCSARSRA